MTCLYFDLIYHSILNEILTRECYKQHFFLDDLLFIVVQIKLNKMYLTICIVYYKLYTEFFFKRFVD